MYFEDTEISKSIDYRKGVLDFCSYYLTEKYVIVEVNEGEHFGEQSLEKLIGEFIEKCPSNARLAYITNRVNCYSSDPMLWYYLGNDIPIVAAAIVRYRNSTRLTANVEKHISNVSIKRAGSLEEAIGWVSKLKELQV